MTTPQPPALVHMTRIVCEVGAVVSLGGPAKHGERRYVPLGGGSVEGPELNGSLVEGGVDWHVQRAVTMNIRGNSYRLKDKLKAGLVRSHDDNASQPGGEF